MVPYYHYGAESKYDIFGILKYTGVTFFSFLDKLCVIFAYFFVFLCSNFINKEHIPTKYVIPTKS
jgi:hypothetical protein